jgi:hypothetical protein
MTGSIVLAALAVLAHAPAAADAPIVTDRPDSPAVVPRGSTQLETLFEYRRERRGEGHSWLAPNLLVRHGLSDRAELRIEAAGWSWTSAGETETADVSIGGKILLNGGGSMPRSLTLFATLPSGSGRESRGRSDYGAWLAAERSLGGLYFLVNAGASRLYREGGRIWNGILWLLTGGDLRPGAAWYGELSADFPEGGRGEPLTTWGVSLSAGDRTQWDVYAGRGLDGSGPSLFVGLGYAVRFD